jgi:hypothetical protein
MQKPHDDSQRQSALFQVRTESMNRDVTLFSEELERRGFAHPKLPINI